MALRSGRWTTVDHITMLQNVKRGHRRGMQCGLFNSAVCTDSKTTLSLNATAMDAQIFQQPISLFKILGAESMTQNKFHIENPQILGTTISNLATMVDWCLGFVWPWSQELQGFQHHTNLDKNKNPEKRDQSDTGAVTLRAWDLDGTEFLQEEEIWLLN
jgi:hypothetical protein